MDETTKAEIEVIKAAERKETDKAKRKRLLIIRLLLMGFSIPEIMNIADCSEKTVYNNQKKYAQDGIAGLTTKPKPGRDKKLNPEQEYELYETIKTKLPRDVGFAPFVNWTSTIAVQWVNQNFSVKFSDRGMRNLFKRLGLSYTRPTYTLKKADPEKQAAFIKEFEVIKKTDF